MSEATERTTTESTDTLLVGFGFSTIPLLRELDASGAEYTIVSERDGSVWAGLDRAGALDFDLVSSYHTSFFSFDQVEDFGEERYPTAREFYDMHRRYYQKYADRIVHDYVTEIENAEDHSIVHTRAGRRYRARRVVIATAFKRKVHASLNDFDFSIRNKTVVLDTIGDSANLMIAKLVTGDNRVICLQNGFLALDKLFEMGKTKFSLDQLEAHQIARHFTSLYSAVIDFNFVRLFKLRPTAKLGELYTRLVRRTHHWLGKLFTPHNFHVDFGYTRRTYEAERPPVAPIPNGIIVIKYWPIDTYAREFSSDLDASIEKGYLLNDILFFVSEGLVELWRKDETKIDEVHKTIERDGEVVAYDHFIGGDAEFPRLPPITYERDGEVREYEYVYKQNYLGVVPSELSGIYFIGYTRPVSGGLANIVEMQCLLVHRLLTDAPFAASLRDTMPEKLERYNRRYYTLEGSGPRDHTTFFGFYTEEVAREVGISVGLRSCRSLRDLAKFYAFPRNATFYRQTGRYAVPKCRELIDHIFDDHKGFRMVWQMILCYCCYQLLTVAIAGSLFVHGWIGGLALAAVAVAQYFFGYWAMIPVSNTTPYFGTKLLSFAVYLPMLLDPRTALLILPLDFALTFAIRQLPGARYPFNDLKNKVKHRGFYQRYKDAYNRLRRPSAAMAAQSAPPAQKAAGAS